MASEDPSLNQVVQQVMDQLSEHVSQLTLLVVRKKLAGEPVPESFKEGVGRVVKAATLIVQVANELANTDYAEFENIKREMTLASKGVETATADLDKTVKEDGGDSIAARWDKMSESFKCIGSNTIRLLEIVYGAEDKRILAAAQRARDACNRLKFAVRDAAEDPQSFSDAASKAGTDVNNLAGYLREKADGETPFRKKELNSLANDLEKRSGAIIDASNDLLADPNNATKADAVRARVNEANQSIDSAIQPIKKDHIQNMTANDYEKMQRDLDAMKDLLNDVAGLKDSNKSDPEKIAILEEVQRLAREISQNSDDPKVEELARKIDAVIAAMLPIKNGKKQLNKDLLAAADDLAGLMAQMIGHAQVDAHKRKNGMTGREAAALELDKLLNQLDNDVREKRDITSLINDLDQLSTTIESGRQSASEGRLGRAVDQAREDVQVAAKRHKTGDPIVDQCHGILDIFAQLSQAAASGSDEQLLITSRTIASEVESLIVKLKEEASKAADPGEKDAILRQCGNLHNIVVQLKILVAVKAAGKSENLDEDEQLAAVTRQLAAGMTGALDAVYVARLKVNSPRSP